MNTTVYLLGAGASAASEFKLPVMKGFFETIPDTGKYAHVFSYIKTYFDHLSTYDINIEELITHLEISLEKYRYSDVESHLACQKELLNYIAKRLQIRERDPCRYHEMLYRKLDQTPDSILTLNYDCVFEQSIFNKDGQAETPFTFLGRSLKLVGYSHYQIEHTFKFDRDEYQKGFYLKLHGSVDWLYCPSKTCVNHQDFQVYPSWEEEKHRRQSGDPCDICGSPLQRVIVMPTMKKAFDNYPKLGFLWEIAFRKLKEADNLVLIGTSLAVSDYYLSWLIRESSIGKENLQVTVVNNSREPSLRAKNLTAVNKVSWYKDFRTWVTGEENCEVL